jgi:hypothetical protein
METNGPVPLAAWAEVELSKFFPQAAIQFHVEPPEEWGLSDPYFNFVLRIDGPFHLPGENRQQFRFDVWMAIEDQGWINFGFGWTMSPSDLEDNQFDELSNAMYSNDEAAVFGAFSQLKGGQVEFVDWKGPALVSSE